MSAQGDRETSFSIHDDQVAPPVSTLGLYYIGTLNQPFCPIASVFHDLHQDVFGVAILRSFNMHPSILASEASHYLNLEAQNFQFHSPSPYCLLAEFLSNPRFFGIVLRNELQGTYSMRSLTYLVALSNLRFSFASAIIILHCAFKGQWNWLLIQGFDPLYTKELAGNEETASFLTNIHIMAGQLAATGDIICRQLKDMLNLTIFQYELKENWPSSSFQLPSLGPQTLDVE
ncbi:hypothetical protein EDB19DRAFT_1831944 [Suillus lakei]|nr:hypothetical protein EDB19DRAFT_1831944 [Suillus lakei]